MIHPAQNIISNLAPTNHVLLDHSCVSESVNFSLKESCEIQEVVKGATVLADALLLVHFRYNGLVDKLSRQNLVVLVVLFVKNHRIRRRTQRPQSHYVVGNVVMQVGLCSRINE